MSEPLDEFRARAADWLAARATPRPPSSAGRAWGEGSDDIAIFLDVDEAEERRLLEAARAWHQEKFDAGWGNAITWPQEHGGRGLSARHAREFRRLEAGFATPDATMEILSVTVLLAAPTLLRHGSPTFDERAREFIRADTLCCQLFSEPEAGSDLAAIRSAAVRDGDSWRVSGQKVWSSHAHLADFGLLICRTDPTLTKHAGLSAFLVPMDAPGITVRPIRQMTGGSSFCEVFLDDVVVPDEHRIGEVGDGWAVAMTMLAFERTASGSGGGGSTAGTGMGNVWPQVHALAAHLGANDDPVVRQELADLYARWRVLSLTNRRAAGRRGATGPEGSIGKLLWTENMRRTSDVVAGLLGPRLTADSGAWGTYAWTEYVLGAPGYRIAGGSDEVQRTIIGTRILGLPAEPSVDRDQPFNQIRRTRAARGGQP